MTAAETRQSLGADLLHHELVRDALASLAALRAEIGAAAPRYVGAVLGTEACLGGAFAYDEIDGFAAAGRLPLGVPVGPRDPGTEPTGTTGAGAIWLAADVLARRRSDARDGRRRRGDDAESVGERQAVSRVLCVAVNRADATVARAHRNWLAAGHVESPAGRAKLEQTAARDDAARRLAAANRKRRQRHPNA